MAFVTDLDLNLFLIPHRDPHEREMKKEADHRGVSLNDAAAPFVAATVGDKIDS